MSAIEYNNLLFEISQRLDELNVLDRLRFLFRGKLAAGSEHIIQDALSLLKELEEQNILGPDRLVEMKELLNGVEEWSLLEKVEHFESKRKEYHCLLEQIIGALDELNELERLIAMCRGKIPEESEDQIRDVRSLFKELENQNHLGIYHLDILKVILTEMENSELLKEVEKFEERRKQEAAIKRKKAKAAAFVSSVGNTLIGVLNIKTFFKTVAVVSTAELLLGWSISDQLVTAINTCVLPPGTSLVNLTDGCLCLTVQAESLSALTTLWNLYQDGTLKRRLYDFFVTDEVKEQAGGETVEVNVSIEEDEYDKACRELISEAREAASTSEGGRIRRNSDSDVYSRTKEEVPLFKLKHPETKLKFLEERVTVIEKEMKYFSLQFLEGCGPEERASFLKQLGISEASKGGEMDENTEEAEKFRRSQGKLMDPGKFAFVQKYLEDIQDTRSITTEASDSGLATHTATSELGTEEINEADKLCLKDLSSDFTRELDERLQADMAATEKVHQFFGLKLTQQFGFTELKVLFPDTPVSVLKKCFESLWIYDLAEIMEKVKSRSLRPALSPEQIEKLRKADDRPTKYHSNVAGLVIDFSVEGVIAEKNEAKKIETFFKDLHSRNETAIISLVSSQERREALREIKKRYLLHRRGRSYRTSEDSLRKQVESTLQNEAHLEKQVEKFMHMNELLAPRREDKQKIKERWSRELERVAKEKKQAERDVEKLKEIEKESAAAISTAIDELIHNQEKFTCVVVFMISDDGLYSEAVLEECVVEKLAIIPDHTKIVVCNSEFKSLAEVPEILHVRYHPITVLPTFNCMIEIFNKRWQTLDLISMMQELKRSTAIDSLSFMYNLRSRFDHRDRYIAIKDSLSTLPTFQKKEEKHSL